VLHYIRYAASHRVKGNASRDSTLHSPTCPQGLPKESSESLESPHKVLTKSSQSLHKVPTKSPHSPHKVLRVPTKSLVSLWFCCTLSEDFVGTLWGLCEDSQDHSRLGHFWALWGLCRDFPVLYTPPPIPIGLRSDSEFSELFFSVVGIRSDSYRNGSDPPQVSCRSKFRPLSDLFRTWVLLFSDIIPSQ
jgi:hypothetical protein